RKSKQALSDIFLFSDQLHAGYERFHDRPCDKIRYRTERENNKISGLFSLKAHERHLCLLGMVKELSGEKIDKRRSKSAGQPADSCDSRNRPFRKHIANGRENVCGPRLMGCTR